MLSLTEEDITIDHPGNLESATDLVIIIGFEPDTPEGRTKLENTRKEILQALQLKQRIQDLIIKLEKENIPEDEHICPNWLIPKLQQLLNGDPT